jgi:hypothetical protein
MNELRIKTCIFCDEPFHYQRSTAKYCSDSCKTTSCNKRKEYRLYAEGYEERARKSINTLFAAIEKKEIEDELNAKLGILASGSDSITETETEPATISLPESENNISESSISCENTIASFEKPKIYNIHRLKILKNDGPAPFYKALEALSALLSGE